MRHLQFSTVLDMGCGNGFLYEKIRARWPNIHYVGLDFNETFINFLNKEHAADNNSQFVLLDIEGKLPDRLVEFADVVFNFFVFFELQNMPAAFKNAAKLLKSGGHLSVLTIEYFYLLLAISDGMRDFKRNLKKYL